VSKLLFAVLSFGVVAAVAGAPGVQGTAKSSDGMRIAYETRGAGDIAVVLVHGWSCDRSYFRHQLESLSDKYLVVSVDLAGHGDSELGRQNSTIASFGADVAAVVKKLRLKRTVLVGHSMGGDVVVAAARLLKGRVIGLVWADDYKDLEPPRSDADIEAFVAQFRADFPGMTDKMVRSLFRADADPALVLSPLGLERLSLVDEGCSSELAAAWNGLPYEDLITTDPSDVEPWATLLVENDPGFVVGESPVLIIHGESDEQIPVVSSQLLLTRMCEAGQVVERRTYPGESHAGVIGPSLKKYFCT